MQAFSSTPAYVKAGWDSAFRGTQHEHLYRTCVDYHNRYISQKRHPSPEGGALYYAPYLFVHQSSGMGKSRLLQQLLLMSIHKEYRHSKEYVCFYFCFRSEQGDLVGGYPPRSGLSDIVTSYESVEQWETFFKALQIYADGHKKDRNKWCDPTQQDWIKDLMAEIKKQGQSQTASKQTLPNADYLVVVDEVGGLSNPNFDNMIRSIASIDPPNIFVVCADTTSKIPNYAAPAELHPSARVHAGKQKLFPPYYLMSTVDLLRDKNSEYRWPSCNSLRGMSRFGRPLWSSLTATGQISKDSLYYLILDKLTSPSFDQATNERVYSHESYIAVILSLLPLILFPGGKKVDRLVASHLAVCNYITEDRESLFATYPSEPIVSYVAMTFLRSPSKLLPLLETLVFSLATLHMSPGDLGEIATPLLLLISMASITGAAQSPTSTPTKTSSSSSSSSSHIQQAPTNTNSIQNSLDDPVEIVTVNALLRSFGGCKPLYPRGASSDEFGLSSELSDAKVNFNHFIYVTYVPTIHHLLQAFIRRAAFVAKPYQEGTDYFIPVLLATKETPTKEGSTITVKDISVIYVQTKNYANTTRDSNYYINATTKLSHEFIHGDRMGKHGFDTIKPYISLYCQLSGQDLSKSTHSFTKKKPEQYCVVRFGHEKLLDGMDWYKKILQDKEKIKPILQRLVNPYPDLIELVSATDRDSLALFKSMTPLRYDDEGAIQSAESDENMEIAEDESQQVAIVTKKLKTTR